MPASLEYNKGDRLKMGRDLEGQTRWYDMTSLQAVPYHIAGNWHCLAGRENYFQQSDWQNMWVEDFIHIALACKCALNYNVLCKSNKPLHYSIIQSSGWPSFS